MEQPAPTEARLPLLPKVLLSLFVAVLIPVYAQAYGLRHFLWFSDVALFLTVAALWRESRLLNSMLVLGALPFESVWVADFLIALVLTSPLGLTEYMFEAERSPLLRGLSLFHLALPPIWIWLLLKWGYDVRALRYWLPWFLALYVASVLATDPERNINWVFLPWDQDWDWLPLPVWLVLYPLVMSLAVYWPWHRLLAAWERGGRGQRQ